MRRVNMKLTLGGARIAVGVAAWLVPAFTTRRFGLGTIATDPNGALVARLFAARDFVLGGAVLVAREPDALTRALEIGLVVDVADIAAAIVSLREGGNRAGALIVGGGAATLAAMGGVLLFTTQRS